MATKKHTKGLKKARCVIKKKSEGKSLTKAREICGVKGHNKRRRRR